MPAPFALLREPILLVLSAPLSSRTSTPIEVSFTSSLALSHAFSDTTAASAAASSAKTARIT